MEADLFGRLSATGTGESIEWPVNPQWRPTCLVGCRMNFFSGLKTLSRIPQWRPTCLVGCRASELGI